MVKLLLPKRKTKREVAKISHGFPINQPTNSGLPHEMNTHERHLSAYLRLFVISLDGETTQIIPQTLIKELPSTK